MRFEKENVSQQYFTFFEQTLQHRFANVNGDSCVSTREFCFLKKFWCHNQHYVSWTKTGVVTVAKRRLNHEVSPNDRV